MVSAPKVAIVLSSGAARGYAHLGVLEVLHASGIKADLIVGTSFGGLVGATYAAGRTPHEMADLARQIDLKKLVSLTDPVRPWDGLVAGEFLEAYFADLVGHTDFDRLPTRAAVVATDIDTGAPVLLDQGEVARAVRASTAIPGIFTPVRHADRVLVDGTLSSRLPVWAAQCARPRLVIAVDVTSEVDGARKGAAVLRKLTGLPRHLGRAGSWGAGSSRLTPPVLRTLVRSANLMGQSMEEPAGNVESKLVLIRPSVERVRWFEFTRADEIRRAGAAAAMQALPEIEKALA